MSGLSSTRTTSARADARFLGGPDPQTRRTLLAGGLGAASAALGCGHPFPTALAPRPSPGPVRWLALDRSQGVVVALDGDLLPVRILRLEAPSCSCPTSRGGALVGSALDGCEAGRHRILRLDFRGRVEGELPGLVGLVALAQGLTRTLALTRSGPLHRVHGLTPAGWVVIREDCVSQAPSGSAASWVHWWVEPQLSGLLAAPRKVSTAHARGSSTVLPRDVLSAPQRGAPTGLTRGAWLGAATDSVPDTAPDTAADEATGAATGAAAQGVVSRALAVGSGVLPSSLDEAAVSFHRASKEAGPLPGAGRLGLAPPARPAVDGGGAPHALARVHAFERRPWAVLWRTDPIAPGAAPRRWVAVKGETVMVAAAPSWWAAVAADGVRAWGASASGDRLGTLEGVAPGPVEGVHEPEARARTSLLGSRRPGLRPAARSSHQVTSETGLRGRTVALLPRWGGVLLVTRTALLFADRGLSPRVLQGGFDHLAGACPMGEPWA